MSHLPAPGSAATALVIGASGGIGGALAAALLQHPGFERVLGTARRPDSISPDVHARLPLDVTDDASLEALHDQVRQHAAQLDLVLYCVGVLADSDTGLAPEKKLGDATRAHLQQAFAVNAIGPLLCARELAGLLPRQQPCTWANLSARVGSIGDNRMGGWYGYRAAKAAQNMITHNMAIELGRRRRQLLCVALHPGTVATALSAPFRAADAAGVQEPSAAAAHLLSVIDGLDPAASGGFFAWDGKEIAW